MSEVILSIRNLSKSFRSHWTFLPKPAVKNVSLDILRGEAFGFLGHNGAGKTTTIKCILGLIDTTEGEVFLNGKVLSSASDRAAIGYLPEQPYFYDHLTVEETLDFLASLYGLKGPNRRKLVASTLERVGLADRTKSSVRALSKGLQQRLGFAQAIIGSPDLLLLDEPFSGLDPLGRHEFRALIAELKNSGVTIMLSSHILSDVQDICDRVSIMVQGELQKVFSIREIPELYGESFEIAATMAPHPTAELKQLIEQSDSRSIDSLGGAHHELLRFSSYDLAMRTLLALEHSGARIEEFRRCSMSLEEIFVQMTEERRNRTP